MRTTRLLSLVLFGITILLSAEKSFAIAPQQSDTVCISFQFRFDDALLMTDYRGNKTAFTQLEQLLVSDKADKIEKVLIIGGYSPEGAIEHNSNLAMKRAMSIRSYIRMTYPHVNNNLIYTITQDNIVGLFIEAVIKDSAIPRKDKVLGILGENSSFSTKWANIKSLQGDAANYIEQNIFPELRSAASCLIIVSPNGHNSNSLNENRDTTSINITSITSTDMKVDSTKHTTISDTISKVDNQTVLGQSDTTKITSEVISADNQEIAKQSNTDIAIDSTTSKSNGTTKYSGSLNKKPLANKNKIAIKTNLLYGAVAAAPNIAAEVALNSKTTIDVRFGINSWGLNGTEVNNKKLAHWAVQGEYRYYLKSSFKGHFFGANLFGGLYNIGGYNIPNLFLGGNLFEERYRYKGWMTGVGINYGYQLHFARSWGVEFSAGIGVAHFNYDKYDCVRCGKKLSTENKTYFGPTRAAISLIYYIR